VPRTSAETVSPNVQPEFGAAETVAEVRIVGNDTTTTAQIASNITTRAGRPYDASVVQRDVSKLANLGCFLDVKALHEATPQGRVVIFQVVERPTIRYVNYLGNEGIRDKTLAKQTGLKAGGSVDPYAVQEGSRKLREYYVSKGFNNVQVTILEGNKATDQGVVYLINEGAKQRIWKTRFVGNDSGFVSDARLKTLIKSKPPILYLFKGYLDRERIDADLELITAYYRSYGYFQARVSRKIDENEKGNWIDLTFVIHEGQQYQVRDVRVLGNTKFEQAPLQEKLALQNGQSFEQMKMEKDAKWLQELYGSQGYVFADIKPETVFLEEPGQVDLVYHIKEGDRFRVGRIFVHIGGDNPHTRIQTALNRVTIVPGQIMDIRELHASERRLLASSLFATDAASGQRPKITYRIPDDEDAEFAEGPKRGIRGQSPDKLGPPVLPPPSASSHPYAVNSRDGDVHIYCDDEAHYQRWQEAELQPDAAVEPPPVPRAAPPAQPAEQPSQPDVIIRGQSPQPVPPPGGYWWAAERSAARHLVQRPPSAYDNVRGQSPNSGAVNQAYATVPTSPQAASPYGGQVVRATGPESAPTNTQVTPVQYAQPYSGYSQNVQPPAGSIYPTPLSPQGPLPGYSVDPSSPLYAAPALPDYPEGLVDIHVEGTETQTGRLMLGVGVNSDAGVVGNIVLDERNFDWTRLPTSWEDVRNGTAWRGAGQRFRIDAAPGSSVNRYLVSFQEPYLFDRPLSLGLSGSYYDRRFRDWDEQRIGGRISLGRQFVERDLSATISYRGENVNIHNPSVQDLPHTPAVEPNLPELNEVLGDNVLHGFRAAIINDTRDSAFLATQGHYFELGGEQVIGTFDYPRVDLDFRQYWMLYERPDHSGRQVLSYSTTIGYTGTHTPIYEHFFAGGFATFRGFDFRGASPMRLVGGRLVELGGEFQWLNSVQYLFPITADDMLHGVVFCDFGTVEENVTINDFRVAPGAGLRITVPAMGPAPIALDFAWALNEAAFDDTQVFSFSLGFSR
jgi:outer membrane protein insertion porin family